MFKIIAFFMITLFVRLQVRIGILLTCGKHLYDSIILQRGEAPHFLLVCLYLEREVSGHVFVC